MQYWHRRNKSVNSTKGSKSIRNGLVSATLTSSDNLSDGVAGSLYEVLLSDDDPFFLRLAIIMGKKLSRPGFSVSHIYQDRRYEPGRKISNGQIKPTKPRLM